MQQKLRRILFMIRLKNMSNIPYHSTKPYRQGNPSRQIYLHISKISAVMVGICQAGVELIHIASVAEQVDTFIDDFLALDSLVFLFSCVTAFYALRSPNLSRALRVGRIAEISFAFGLLVMVGIAVFTAFSKISK
jgi:hypothetical protein